MFRQINREKVNRVHFLYFVTIVWRRMMNLTARKPNYNPFDGWLPGEKNGSEIFYWPICYSVCVLVHVTLHQGGCNTRCCCKTFCKEKAWSADYPSGLTVFLDMILLTINCDLIKKNTEYVSSEILLLSSKNFSSQRDQYN